MKLGKFKLKICSGSNEPIVKAQAESLDEFDPLIEQLKRKYKGMK